MFALIGAMDAEVAEFVSHLKDDQPLVWNSCLFHRGIIGSTEVVVVRCGVGKVQAAMLTQYLISSFAPEAVIMTGLAGALNEDLQIGDIAVSVDCLQHDMDCRPLGFRRGEIPFSGIYAIAADSNLCMRALKFDGGQTRVMGSRFLSGDQFVTAKDRESHDYLRAELGGDVVDMEAASVALVASSNQVPFLVLKTVSDRANGEAISDFNAFLPRASKHMFALIEHLLSE